MTICILGRQPALGLAELESLYGASVVRPVGTQAALVDDEVNFLRLGGSVKAGEALTSLPGTNPQKAFLWLTKNIAEMVDGTEGKIKLGVSLYDVAMPLKKLNANTLSLKKVLRDAGHSVRVVPNTELELSSAQTHHNNLTDERGCEIMIVRDGDTMLIARATNVQNIDAYRKRDQERPMRDAYVGMLPPKLAQIIINLASGGSAFSEGSAFPAERSKKNDQLAESAPEEKVTDARLLPTLLDPFCGTGVILQEAALMGYQVYGTDVSEKMVRYSRDNLNWFREKNLFDTDVFYEVADATDHTWRKPVDIVACEGYLGHPFSNEPSKEALMESMQTSGTVMKKFLQNIAPQLKNGTRLCVALPVWHVKNQVHHLPLIERLSEFGFERVVFKNVSNNDLIYRREGQVVGRELVVIRTVSK